MNKVKSFIKQTVAIIKGDDAAALAEKNYRLANSAFKTELAKLEGDTVDLEQSLQDAKEALATRRLNGGVLITDRVLYLTNLLNAKNAVTIAEEKLTLHQAKVEFFKEQSLLLNAEEDEE
jgi:hypothetical protein